MARSRVLETASLLVCLSVLLCYVSGAEYFISPYGSDNNSGTSPSSPFLTLSKALSVSAPRDTINAAEGTYSGSANTDLTVTSRAIVGASDGATVFESTSIGLALFANATVDSVTMTGGSVALVLQGAGSVIRNVTFSSVTTAIRLSPECTSVHVANSTFDYTVQYGVFFSDSSPILWQDVLIEGCSFVVRTSALQIYATATADTPNFQRFIVRDCEFAGAYNAVHWGHGPETTTFSGCSFTNITISTALSLSGNQFWIEDCVFTDNNAGYNAGGAIFYQAVDGQFAELLVERSVFKGNSATSGGAIAYYGTDLFVKDSVFVGNSATNSGGAFYVAKGSEEGTALFNNTIFLGNTAEVSGGALYTVQSTSFVDSAMAYNSCGSNGGAYAAFAGAQSLSNCIVLENFADGDGGGLYVTYSVVAIDSLLFAGNNATNGGAVFIDEATASFTCDSSSFSENYATANGGATLIDSTGTSSFQNSTFQNNTANTGGGVAVVSDKNSVSLEAIVFEDNMAYTSGGGLYCSGGTVDFDDISFSGNSAGEGSAYMCDGACDITSEDVYIASDNSAIDCDGSTPSGVGDMSAQLGEIIAQLPRSTCAQAAELLDKFY